jgi:hypothetical protein
VALCPKKEREMKNIVYISSVLAVALLMVNLLVLREPSTIVGYFILGLAMVPTVALVAEELNTK